MSEPGLASSAPHPDPRFGERYVIERELGRGGMGTVYLARDVRLDRPVALKVLPPEFAASPSLRERFLRETRTAASFSHPNIVPVYAVEEAGDAVAFAMAYVEGESLADRVKRGGPLGVRDTVRILQDVGYALAYAHGRGVVHRDIKPDNIMIERATGRAMVMDFGIARVITAPDAGIQREGLTRVGEIVGTPEYMSPEQATGDTIDGRSDLYSLGLTAHFAVTGRAPIGGTTTGQILMRQITEELPPVLSERPDLPPALSEVIDRCVQKDPAQRFANAESLVEALDAAQLAAPEIPLPIRLFAEEVGTLSMVIFFALVISLNLARTFAGSESGDAVLIVLVLFGVFATRVMQTMGEVARMAASGFSEADIHRGLEAVMAEREHRRQELRADPEVREARKKTIRVAILEILLAALLFRLMFFFRHPNPNGGNHIHLEGSLLIISSLLLFGIGFAQLVRSPVRMPAGERIFRNIWLGSLGRAFIRFSGRKIWKGQPDTRAASVRVPSTRAKVASLPTQPASAVRPAAVAAGTPDARVAALETRVDELERWRKSL